MKQTIPLTKPYTDESEAAMVREVLASGWITGGPRVAEFEKRVAAYVGVSHAVATSSGTTALTAALQALGIGPGDEVVVPSFSFIATANAVLHVGATPRFADIDLETYNITAETIADVLSPRTKAIMPVHQVGLPADLDPIGPLAKTHGLYLLEDAACALGSEYHRRRIGGHTACACFSFHPRKVITTGEGGMVTTNDEKLARLVRMLCNHGANVTEMEKHVARRPVQVSYPVPGYNFRLTDLQAAVGIAQMAKLENILQRRRVLARRYQRAFAELPELALPEEPNYALANYQSYMVRLRDADAEKRWVFLNALKALGISATPGITAIHRQDCYVQRLGVQFLPNTELAADTTAILPLFPDMAEVQQVKVIQAVKASLVPISRSVAA